MLLNEGAPLFSVTALDLRLDPLDEATRGLFVFGDPSLVHGDLVRTADALAGALLVRFDVARSFVQRVERAGVEPAVLVAHEADFELAKLQVGLVDAGDLDLAAVARLHVLGDLDDAVVIGVEADDRIVARGVLGLLDDRGYATILVEPYYTVSLRIEDFVSKDSSTLNAVAQFREAGSEPITVEQVVTEYEHHRIVSDEVGADRECLRETFRFGLFGVLEADTPLRTITEQLLELWLVGRCCDDQNFSDASEHERGERVVDHRLVVDVHQLLADTHSDWVESGARPTRENNSLHYRTSLCVIEFDLWNGADFKCR